MFLTRTQYIAARSAPVTAADFPSGAMLNPRVGYLMLPAVTKTAATARYPVVAQHILATEDAAGACGWIVDLRDNLGGNFHPMVEAAAPLLDGGKVGAFVDPDGHRTPWTISPAGFSVGATLEATVLHARRYQLAQAAAPLPPLTTTTRPTRTPNEGDCTRRSSRLPLLDCLRGRAGSRSRNGK